MLRTRKPINLLTPEDLKAFPIWTFALEEEVEEQDETWVRPFRSKVLREGLYSMQVAADFTTASGQTLPGFVDVSTAEGLELGGAVLLATAKYLPVGLEPGAPLPKRERKRVATALGLREEDVFPLQFTLRVLIRGEKRYRGGEFA